MSHAHRLALIALTVLIGSSWPVAPSRALQETQTIVFPTAPAWYFISLQVDPDATQPSSVFPLVGNFAYDRLWGYDPVDGWRHYSPVPGTLTVLNDLFTIEPLRGYWMHVTSVEPGGSALQISGERVTVLSLEGAAFHATGALIPHDAPPRDVATVFAELGAALNQRISRVFRHDFATDSFHEITQFVVADCATSTECLAPGQSYWVETTGDVTIGKFWELSQSCMILTPTGPISRLDIGYEGIGAAKGSLRVVSGGGAGLRFLSSENISIDGVSLPRPDLDDSSVLPGGHGPDTQADFGAGSVACLDTCGGATGCVDLCFANSASEHTLFAAIDLATLLATPSYSSCTQGTPYATLELTIDGEVVEEVRVAVKPPTVLGRFAGRLVYEDGGAGEVPFGVHLLDCPPDSQTGSPQCGSGRAASVVNPTLLAARGNGFDEDGDGDVDEPDEAGRLAHRRDTPGYSSDTALYGELSPNRGQLRLSGTSAVAGIEFAQGGGADSGAASLLAPATRTLTLDGFRTHTRRFAGTFTEEYAGALGTGLTRASGRFELLQVDAPECVAPNPLTQEAVGLGIDCRDDGDCPLRCTGGSEEIEGFRCTDATGCQGGSCEPYPCSFPALGGASRQVVGHETGTFDLDFTFLTGDPDPQGVLVDLEGPARVRISADGAGASRTVGLPPLPCGTYSLSVAALNCRDTAPMTLSVDLCAGPIGPFAITCQELTPEVAPATALTGGAISLAVGFPLTTPARLVETAPPGTPIVLNGVGGEAAVVGREPTDVGWTSYFRWAAVAIRGGLLELD